MIIVIQSVVIGAGVVLGEKVNEQSEERRQALEQLNAALVENAGLHAQLVAQAREAGVLEERGRMAREIHDTIAQGLTGIVTQLEAADQARERPAERDRHLEHAKRLARESLAEARRSVEASMPGAWRPARCPRRSTRSPRDWSERNGIPVDVTVTGVAIALHPDIEVALLRTAQEALANVAKHADASRVGLTLSFMGDVVTLDVRDDGVGFTRRRAGRAATGAASASPACASAWRGSRDRSPSSPSRAAEPPSPPASPRSGSPHRRRAAVSAVRLLIVDDHPVVRDGLRGMLAGDPTLEVVGEAADGAEALAVVGSLGPDVILMDLRMPGLGGVATIRALAERGSPARVLVLTTYDSDTDVVPAIEAGATGYLLKDSPREELVRAIHAAAGARRSSRRRSRPGSSASSGRPRRTP